MEETAFKDVWVTINEEDVWVLCGYRRFIRTPDYPPGLIPEDNEWGMLSDNVTRIRFFVRYECKEKQMKKKDSHMSKDGGAYITYDGGTSISEDLDPSFTM